MRKINLILSTEVLSIKKLIKCSEDLVLHRNQVDNHTYDYTDVE